MIPFIDYFFNVFVGLVVGSFLLQKGINRWKDKASTKRNFGAILLIIFGLWIILPSVLGSESKHDPLNILISIFNNHIKI
jgi:hypothetical protein